MRRHVENRLTWTCVACGASGDFTVGFIARPHDCLSRHPFDLVPALRIDARRAVVYR